MATSDAIKSANRDKRKTEAGLKRVRVYVPIEREAEIKKLADQMCEEAGITEWLQFSAHKTTRLDINVGSYTLNLEEVIGAKAIGFDQHEVEQKAEVEGIVIGFMDNTKGENGDETRLVLRGKGGLRHLIALKDKNTRLDGLTMLTYTKVVPAKK